MAENVSLLIGTPACRGQVHVDYLSALPVFQRESIPFTLMTIANESLITRARNTIISAFHERREFTHLLFLDGDVHLPREGLARMLGSGKDVVGAPVALKGVGTNGARLFNVGNTVGEDGTLLVVERVGAAANAAPRWATAVSSTTSSASASSTVSICPKISGSATCCAGLAFPSTSIRPS